jgi:RimJ/RimL family protein N-acetyltransferase
MARPPWPLFELELTTPRLVLRVPTDDDLPGLLEAVDAGIHDPSVMPFTLAWTDTPAEERRLKSLQHWWGQRANWSSEDWHLPLAVFYEDAPVGIQELFALRSRKCRPVPGSLSASRAEG